MKGHNVCAGVAVRRSALCRCVIVLVLAVMGIRGPAEALDSRTDLPGKAGHRNEQRLPVPSANEPAAAAFSTTPGGGEALEEWMSAWLPRPEACRYPDCLALEKAVEIAVDANLDRKIFGEGIAAAEARRMDAKSAFLPRLVTQYRYAHFGRDAFESITTGELNYSQQDQFEASVSLIQNLFSGYADLKRYEIADIQLERERVGDAQAVSAIAYETRERYIAVLRALKKVELNAALRERLEGHEAKVKEYYEKGLAPLNELLETQIYINRAGQDIRAAETEAAIARESLNQYLEMPLETSFRVTPLPIETSFPLDLSRCVEIALENSHRLRMADLDIQIARREKDLANSDRYPSVDLSLNYYRFGEDWYLDGFDETGLSRDNWSFLTSISYNFTDMRSSFYRTREKLSRIRQSEYRKRSAENRVVLEVRRAFMQMAELSDRIEGLSRDVDTAGHNLSIVERKYLNFLTPSSEVINGHRLLKALQDEYHDARFNYKSAENRLLQALRPGR